MHIFSISETEFELDLRWIFESVTNYLDVLTRILALSEVSVPYTPKRILGRLVPYHLAGRLMVLMDFAKAQKQVDRHYVEEVICDYARMMTLNVLSYTEELATADEDDEDDDETDSGNKAFITFEEAYNVIAQQQSHACAVVMMGAYARAKLNENRPLNAIELLALTGLDENTARRRGISSVEDNSGHYLFNCDEIKQYLMRD